jgi:hypothetical protein
MKKLIFITVCLLPLLFNSCEKEGNPKEHEFQYLATKDVQWKFHFQGRMVANQGSVIFDTSYHRYLTAGPTGKTEIINDNTAYYYFLKADNYKSGVYVDSDSGIVVLREDLEDKRIYMLSSYPGIGVLGDYEAVDFSDYSGETRFDYRYENLPEYEDGTIMIDGIATTKSSIILPGKGSKFYKARGIGGPYGPFGDNAYIQGHGGYIISMDFIYKGKIYHFDY